MARHWRDDVPLERRRPPVLRPAATLTFMPDPSIRVRIAPSPTGPLHIGTARTALFNFLFARHVGGTFLLRMEDTDVARSSEAFERDILDGLHWLGITWDEGPDAAGGRDRGPYAPYRQMQRLDSYRAAADRLLAADQAYPCFCTPDELDADRKAQEAAKQPPRYVGRCANLTAAERATRQAETGRPPAIRFRVRPGIVGWDDLVRDRIEIDTANLGGDFVIVRGDGTPLYHFTVVVDDAAMAISHVIRGEDHVGNTPKHILLFEALGHPVPRFGHLPLILNPDRTKMSKRKSQTAIDDYRAQGFIAEGLVNYLSFLGWSPGTEEDVLSLDEVVERFDIDKVQRGGAVFDRDRLEWLNGQWIRRLDPDDLIDRLRPFLEAAVADGRIDRLPAEDELRALLPVVHERLPTLASVVDLVGFLWTDDLGLDPAHRDLRSPWRAGQVSAIEPRQRRVAAGRVPFDDRPRPGGDLARPDICDPVHHREAVAAVAGQAQRPAPSRRLAAAHDRDRDRIAGFEFDRLPVDDDPGADRLAHATISKARSRLGPYR